MSRQLTLAADVLPPNRILGLHVDWLTGSVENGASFRLVCGAGLGGSMIGVHVTLPDGTSIIETATITDLCKQWVGAILDEQAQVGG